MSRTARDTLKKFLDAWINDDLANARKVCSKTYLLSQNKVLELETLFEKKLAEATIEAMVSLPGTEFMKDSILLLRFAEEKKPFKFRVRLISEKGYCKPARPPEGDWGVRPDSIVRVK